MVKIAFFDIKDWEKKHLQSKLKDHTLKFFEGSISDNDITKIKSYDVISVFIYSKITKDLLSKLPKLKLIVTRSTGFDHVDIKACKKQNVSVANVPFYGENTVAEHTFALILSISRNIHKSYLRTTQGNYSIEGLTGFDLKGKTIGIVGGGSIGMHVARMAKAFSMNIIVFDIHKNNFLSEVLNFKYVSLEELFKKSDIISLHLPHNKYTHHLINMDNVKSLKKGVILINTSRGEIIDNDALLYGLDKKIIGGAGLDVIEGEDIIKEENQLLHSSNKNEKLKLLFEDKKIFNMENVVFTPHNAFNSKEALMRILNTTISNIVNFVDDKPSNIVN